jgi:type I restriction enzyme S subunit
MFTERNERNDGIGAKQLLSLSYGRVIRKDIEGNDGLRPESYATYQQIQKDNIVLRLIDLQNDKRSIRVGQTSEPGIITSAYVALDTDAWACARYAFYLLLVLDQLKVFYGLGSGMRQSITFSDLGRVPVAVPAAQEQLAIATYLDAETKRIDGLIEEKQRLADMLIDLRGGVIRERTTGADLKTDQRATGDVFMPQLPAGWSLVALGRYSRITNGSTPLKDNPTFWHGGHFPWLNSSVVNGDEVTEGSELVTAEALRQCHLPIVPAGSILVALTGQGKTRGQATMLRIEATINQHLAAIVCDEDHLDGEFVFWALTGQYAALRMVSDGQGGTKGALTCDELGRFRIPKPPVEVQRSIAKALYEETRRIDELFEHVGAEVEMLKELRSATITDAVFGRIDVRSHMKN